jgi:hypothetical protein
VFFLVEAGDKTQIATVRWPRAARRSTPAGYSEPLRACGRMLRRGHHVR